MTPHEPRKDHASAPAVLLLDRLGVIRATTPAACTALARSADRLTGRPLHDVAPGAKALVYAWIDALGSLEGIPPPKVFEVEADCAGQFRQFDGVLYALQSGAAAQSASGIVAGLKLRPSSLLLARSEALGAQRTLLDQIGRGATLRDTLREVARFAERQMSPETFCAIATTDESGARFERAVVAGLPREVGGPYEGLEVATQALPAAVALSTNQPVFATDLDARAAWLPFSEFVRRHGLRAAWSYPVRPGGGARSAALDFLLTAQRTPSPVEARIAEQVASLAALAINLDHLRNELASRTANLATIVASLPVVMWETDARGVVTLIEGGALGAVKLHAADAVGRRSGEVFGASDATQALVLRALQGETAWADVPALGRIFAIGVAPIRSDRGDVSGMRGLALDITERKQAERAVREGVERLNLVIDAANDGFWDFRLDGGEGMMSDRCAQVLGQSPDGMPMVPPDRHPWVHPEDAPMVAQAWRDHLAGRSARYESEHRRIAADGSVRWILDRGRVVERDAAGAPVRVAGTQTDVTARRALEQSALAAQKMEALGQVARGFAQDLATVLASIRGHASLAALSQGVPPRVAESLEVIQLAAAHGSALTHNLTALGTPTPIQRRITSVADAVEEALRLLRPVMPSQVSVERRDDSRGDSRVRADPSLLQQVLFNLLLRARDAMPSGGTLRIRISRSQREGFGAEVGVEVADTGRGIPAHDLPHVFDAFRERTGDGVGGGLALALVRSFVDSCGGRIEVRSAPTGGTTFEMMLPAAEVVAAPEAAVRQRVVLGERHPLLRPMLAQALQQSGFEVVAVDSRERLLEEVRGLADRAGAVVADLALMGPDPLAAAAAIREAAGRPVRVVLAAPGPTVETGDPQITVMPRPFDVDALRRQLLVSPGEAGA